MEQQKKYITACRKRDRDCTDRVRDVYLKANVEYWRSVADSRKGTYYVGLVGLGVGATSLVALVIVVIWACVNKKKASAPSYRNNSPGSLRSQK